MLSMNRRHVLAAEVAEVLGHGERRERDAEAGARGLVHLAEHHDGSRENARLAHLEPEVVALARALADAGEHRVTAVVLGDVVDQLLNEDRLADPGAAEQAGLATARVGREQVDDLEARLEDLGLGTIWEKRAPWRGSAGAP